MRRHRSLLATLLVVFYAAMSTFGAAFIICVERDGRQNLEAVGATCCVTTSPAQFAEPDEPAVSAESPSSDCEDCQAHFAAVDIETPRIEDSKAEASTPVLLPPPALPADTASSSAGLTFQALRAHAPPPRPFPAVACLRSVVLRC